MTLIATSIAATKHFSLEELACPCCGELIISSPFIEHMALLEVLRGLSGFPLIVTSGHRCAKHNKEVGGTPKSQHLMFATDIQPEAGETELIQSCLHIYKIALTQRWTGIGYSEGSFLHLDLRPGKRVVWRY